MSKYFVTCARGLEEIAEVELRRLGSGNTEKVPGGVYFEGDQDTLYKAHLWLRTGNRILLPLRSFPCHSPDDIYDNISKFRWETFLTNSKTFALECTLSGRLDPRLSHSQYAKLRAKDAIVDRLREKTGSRPNVDVENPDIRAVLYVRDGVCTLNLDATGGSLHERGYRGQFAEAPLKETLAAGLLLLAGYKQGMPFLDPMCGSGTLVCEAALIATNTAPGLFRRNFSFMNWPDFHLPRWQKHLEEAKGAVLPLPGDLLFAFDSDRRAVTQTRRSLSHLGFSGRVEVGEFSQLVRPESVEAGLILMNPPYGERLGDESDLIPLYKQMGDTFKKQFSGWKAGVFTGSPVLAKSVGLKSARKFPLWNGAIECRLLTYDLFSGSKRRVD